MLYSIVAIYFILVLRPLVAKYPVTSNVRNLLITFSFRSAFSKVYGLSRRLAICHIRYIYLNILLSWCFDRQIGSSSSQNQQLLRMAQQLVSTTTNFCLGFNLRHRSSLVRSHKNRFSSHTSHMILPFADYVFSSSHMTHIPGLLRLEIILSKSRCIPPYPMPYIDKLPFSFKYSNTAWTDLDHLSNYLKNGTLLPS